MEPVFQKSIVDFGTLKETDKDINFEFELLPDFDINRLDHYHTIGGCTCLTYKFDPTERKIKGTFSPANTPLQKKGYNQKNFSIIFRLKEDPKEYQAWGPNDLNVDPYTRKQTPKEERKYAELKLTAFVFRKD